MFDIKDSFVNVGKCQMCEDDIYVSKNWVDKREHKYCEKCIVEGNQRDHKNNVLSTVDNWFDRLMSNTERKEQYGIPRRYMTASVDNFEGEAGGKVSEWSKTSENLLIQSPKAGNGKTHLAIGAMLSFVMSKREKSKLLSWEATEKENRTGFMGNECTYVYPKAMFVNFADLMLEVKASFDSKDITEQDVIKKYTSYTILVVDDIGAEKSSDYTQAVIYSILNRRYESMVPTIITTNLSSGDITGSYGSRILSRIASGTVITLDGKDRRLNK